MNEQSPWIATIVRPADLCCALWIRERLRLQTAGGIWKSPTIGGLSSEQPTWPARERDQLGTQWSKWWDHLIASRSGSAARHTDEGDWPADLPPTSPLRTVVEKHSDELARWTIEHQRRVFESAAEQARHDHKIAGSLSSAVRRHRPNETVDFDIHAIEGIWIRAVDVGFVSPQRQLCVVWGDLSQDQAAYDGVVKALTGAA